MYRQAMILALLSVLLLFGLSAEAFNCSAQFNIHVQPPAWPSGMTAHWDVHVDDPAALLHGWRLNFTARGFGTTPAFNVDHYWNAGSVHRTDNGDNTITYTMTNAVYNAQSALNVGFNAFTTLAHPWNSICGVSMNNVPCTTTISPAVVPPDPSLSSILLAFDYYNTDKHLPLLVLVHGITDSRQEWAPIIPLLKPYFRILNVDLRGHGQSQVTTGNEGYTPQAMADDVFKTVQMLAGANARPLMVGHSLGGIIVTVYGHFYPTRGVINVDQTMDLKALQPIIQSFRANVSGDEAAFKAFFNSTAMFGALDQTEIARLLALKNPIQHVVLSIWAPFFDFTPAQMDTLVDGVMKYPGGTPYLALFGSDPAPSYSAWLAARIPFSAVETWPGLGHYLHLAKPQEFAQRVREFDSIRQQCK